MGDEVAHVDINRVDGVPVGNTEGAILLGDALYIDGERKIWFDSATAWPCKPKLRSWVVKPEIWSYSFRSQSLSKSRSTLLPSSCNTWHYQDDIIMPENVPRCGWLSARGGVTHTMVMMPLAPLSPLSSSPSPSPSSPISLLDTDPSVTLELSSQPQPYHRLVPHWVVVGGTSVHTCNPSLRVVDITSPSRRSIVQWTSWPSPLDARTDHAACEWKGGLLVAGI
jgi:hypothetical protein